MAPNKYLMRSRTIGVDEAEPFCLRWLMSRCPDFMTEVTQLEYIMRKLGVEMLLSPKCHPELAGQGVEYGWGESKKYYRKGRNQMSAKITESQFRALVESSLRGGPDVAGSTAPLQLTSVLIFARKAHFYKIAYWSLRAGTDRTKTICMKEIEDAVEKLQAKTYKKHRSCDTVGDLTEA